MDAPVLDRAAVGALLKVAPETVTKYLIESRPGGRYADHPFPPSDGRIGRAPYWLPERGQEIADWDKQRLGQGSGGGPKRKP